MFEKLFICREWVETWDTTNYMIPYLYSLI